MKVSSFLLSFGNQKPNFMVNKSHSQENRNFCLILINFKGENKANVLKKSYKLIKQKANGI